jgi:hypothetical protein
MVAEEAFMKSVLRLRNHLLGATLLGAAAILGSISAATAASLTVIPNAALPAGYPASGTDTWKQESGQSIPTGTMGYLDGTLTVTAGQYTFTYGPPGLVAGATGHGDSVFLNDFYVGTSLATAIPLGHAFCTEAASGCAAASTVGDQFTMNLPAGPVAFGFTFGPTLNVTLLNGQVSDQGAYLVQIGLGTSANAGPGQVAYLGLSDRPYPGTDHDFQDLTLSITATPLPAALPLFAGGLGALGLLGWRRKRKAAALAAA